MRESLRSLAYGFQISHCITKKTVWEFLQLVCQMTMPFYLPSPFEHDLTRNSWVLGKMEFSQLCGNKSGRKHVQILCARSVAPLFQIQGLLLDCMTHNTYLLKHTFVPVKEVSWQHNLFKIYIEKKHLLQKFWFIRTYQTAKLWIFLPHLIIGNNECAHVSPTDWRKKSQHKDSQ